MANYRYTAIIYDFGRDLYGNSTAHYRVMDRGQTILSSGKRRQQTGYDGTHAEAAVYALQEATGRDFRTVRLDGDRYGNWCRVAFIRV